MDALARGDTLDGDLIQSEGRGVARKETCQIVSESDVLKPEEVLSAWFKFKIKYKPKALRWPDLINVDEGGRLGAAPGEVGRCKNAVAELSSPPATMSNPAMDLLPPLLDEPPPPPPIVSTADVPDAELQGVRRRTRPEEAL